MAMIPLDIRINNRTYRVMCEEDRTDHLQQLADELDYRVKSVTAVTKRADDATALVLAGLILADELYDARMEAGDLREKFMSSGRELSDVLSHGNQIHAEQQLADLMKEISVTLGRLTHGLEKP